MSLKNLILILTPILITSCGGGSSNSGPAAPPRIFATAGIYTADLTADYFRNGEKLGDSANGTLRITVAGQDETQQAIIAFREFSGSSNISPTLEFSIPSGNFDLFGSDPDIDCIGQLTFSGRFSSNVVNGQVSGDFNCGSTIGVITSSGSFSGALSSGKSRLNDDADPDFLPFEL